MKAGISPLELAQRVQNVMAATEDLIVPSKNLRYSHDEATNGLALEIDLDEKGGRKGHYSPTKLFTNQVSERLQIPSVYYNRLDTSDRHLLAYSLNRLNATKGERRMVRTLKNGVNTARAYLSDRYRILDNAEVLEQMIPAMMAVPGLEIVDCELTEHRMYIKAITPRVAGEVKRGDVVQAGVIISNSEVGAGALNISPLVFRLVCLNGMIIPENKFRALHLGKRAEEGESVYALLSDETKAQEDRTLLMKARDVAAAIFQPDYFESLLGRMRAATEEQATTKRPDKAVEVLAKQVSLNEGEQVSVLTHLLQGGDFSRWGFANAVTRAAQDVGSYDRSVQLEQLGSRVMELPAREWKAVATAEAA